MREGPRQLYEGKKLIPENETCSQRKVSVIIVYCCVLWVGYVSYLHGHGNVKYIDLTLNYIRRTRVRKKYVCMENKFSFST